MMQLGYFREFSRISDTGLVQVSSLLFNFSLVFPVTCCPTHPKLWVTRWRAGSVTPVVITTPWAGAAAGHGLKPRTNEKVFMKRSYRGEVREPTGRSGTQRPASSGGLSISGAKEAMCGSASRKLGDPERWRGPPDPALLAEMRALLDTGHLELCPGPAMLAHSEGDSPPFVFWETVSCRGLPFSK